MRVVRIPRHKMLWPRRCRRWRSKLLRWPMNRITRSFCGMILSTYTASRCRRWILTDPRAEAIVRPVIELAHPPQRDDRCRGRGDRRTSRSWRCVTADAKWRKASTTVRSTRRVALMDLITLPCSARLTPHRRVRTRTIRRISNPMATALVSTAAPSRQITTSPAEAGGASGSAARPVGAATGVVVPADLRPNHQWPRLCTWQARLERLCFRRTGEKSPQWPAVLLAFRHRKYGGQTIAAAAGSSRALRRLLRHRRGARRSDAGVRRLVCSGVGRLGGDQRGLRFAGGLWIPGICGRECRSCSATRARPPAAGLDGDDRRSGRVGVRRDRGAIPPSRARQCPYLVSAGGDGRVLLIFPLVACVALLVFPSGYPGVAPFTDAAGRRDRRRSRCSWWPG